MDKSGLGRREWVWPALIGSAIVVIYALFWPAVTGDMNIYLIPWLDVILEKGRLGAFAEPFSNYTPAYLYLLSATSLLYGVLSKFAVVKLLSVAGTAALALSVLHLLKATGADRPWQAALWVMLLPSVVFNGPGFGQCDAMWSAACVMAVAEAVRRRPVAMLVWAGVAIAFKAQAAFVAPFIIARLLSDRAPLFLWIIPPAVYAGVMLPAWLLGWPAADLATIYLRQVQWGPDFLGNASNPWIFARYYFPEAGVRLIVPGQAVAIGAALAYLAAFGRRPLSRRDMVAAALLAALLLPWLLPKMHERFFFLADVLAFAFAFIARDRRAVTIAILVQASSLLAIAGLMLELPWCPMAGSMLVLAAILLTIAELRKQKQRDDPAPERMASGPVLL